MSRRVVRVLQIVGVMDRAGLETWLMHVLRTIDREWFKLDFLVETATPGAYDDEIRSLGARVLYAGPRRPLLYGRLFRRLLAQQGPYDVVHSHLNHLNGDIMRLACAVGIPTRIAHSHTDTTAKERAAAMPRRLLVRLMQHWIARYATHGLAASIPAAVSMFGAAWQQNAQRRVLHCGLDLSPFAEVYERLSVRRSLDIPADAWVVGQVGRFDDVKNHRLTIDTFAAIRRQVPEAWLLLVGDGPLRAEIEDQARRLNVLDRVCLTGNRNDVPRLLCAAIDTFMFPSKFEGLGMALVEAQAAGLPCLVSDAVPTEADVIPELITRLSINQSWAAALMATRTHDRRQTTCLDRVLQSDFSIHRGVEALEKLYSTSRSHRRD